MENKSNVKTPLIRMAKRDDISKKDQILIRVIGILASLLTGAIVILLLGNNPISVYAEMVAGSIGKKTVLIETIKKTIPLLITSLGLSLAFKMKFWNIGGEGQILIGGIAATYFALFHADWPSFILIPVMLIAALVAGAIWGLIPALFKAKFGTNETLFTLMLNYIALGFLSFLENGPWMDPSRNGFPIIATFEDNAVLPKLFGIHIGWIFALLLVVIIYIYINKTKHGYEITVVGESPATAKYAGMSVGKIFIRTMLLSGALCGLVGFLQVSGADKTLNADTAGGVGFTAITVAWLSHLNPGIMLVVAFFIAMLEKGANTIQTTFKIPASAAEVLTGIILFFMLGCEFFINYKLIFRKKGGNE